MNKPLPRKRYAVCLPFTGYRYLEVEASSREEALNEAHEIEFTWDNIAEMESCDHVTTGNVFHGVLNSYSMEEIKEEE